MCIHCVVAFAPCENYVSVQPTLNELSWINIFGSQDILSATLKGLWSKLEKIGNHKTPALQDMRSIWLHLHTVKITCLAVHPTLNGSSWINTFECQGILSATLNSFWSDLENFGKHKTRALQCVRSVWFLLQNHASVHPTLEDLSLRHDSEVQ